ncbi:MAG: hypothetical protein ACI93R_003109 [Flavobacteriales bacterium]|jgi:hypothetical protein
MENKDLVWDIENFKKRQEAKDFLLSVENQLCVFSGIVEQLYTNYDVFFPKEESRKIVILPNPYAPHDTFHGIPDEAVRATGLFLLKTGGADERSLQLAIPLRKGTKRYRRVPLGVGLKMINAKRPEDKPFLPVVMKGDLREFNQNIPCIHLHSLTLDDVPMLSEMELSGIQSVVEDRLHLLVSKF